MGIEQFAKTFPMKFDSAINLSHFIFNLTCFLSHLNPCETVDVNLPFVFNAYKFFYMQYPRGVLLIYECITLLDF